MSSYDYLQKVTTAAGVSTMTVTSTSSVVLLDLV